MKAIHKKLGAHWLLLIVMFIVSIFIVGTLISRSHSQLSYDCTSRMDPETPDLAGRPTWNNNGIQMIEANINQMHYRATVKWGQIILPLNGHDSFQK